MVGNYIPEDRRIGFTERTKHFAWLPVKLKNGKYAWLSTVIKVRQVVVSDSSTSLVLEFLGLGRMHKDVFHFEQEGE